jgi:hypothetical protein
MNDIIVPKHQYDDVCAHRDRLAAVLRTVHPYLKHKDDCTIYRVSAGIHACSCGLADWFKAAREAV